MGDKTKATPPENPVPEASRVGSDGQLPPRSEGITRAQKPSVSSVSVDQALKAMGFPDETRTAKRATDQLKDLYKSIEPLIQIDPRTNTGTATGSLLAALTAKEPFSGIGGAQKAVRAFDESAIAATRDLDLIQSSIRPADIALGIDKAQDTLKAITDSISGAAHQYDRLMSAVRPADIALGIDKAQDTLKAITDSISGAAHQYDRLMSAVRPADIALGIDKAQDTLKAITDSISGAAHQYDRLMSAVRPADIALGIDKAQDTLKAITDSISGAAHQYDRLMSAVRPADILKGIDDAQRTVGSIANTIVGAADQFSRWRSSPQGSEILDSINRLPGQYESALQSIGNFFSRTSDFGKLIGGIAKQYDELNFSKREASALDLLSAAEKAQEQLRATAGLVFSGGEHGAFVRQNDAALTWLTGASTGSFAAPSMANAISIAGALSGVNDRAIAGALMADAMTAEARTAGTLADVAGRSLAADVLASGTIEADVTDERAVVEAVTAYLDRLTVVVTNHLATIRTPAQAIGLLNWIVLFATVASTFIALAALYVAMEQLAEARKSTSTQDTERQTAILAEKLDNNSEGLRNIEQRLNEFRITTDEMLREKLKQMPPHLTYLVRRGVPVKSIRKWKSPDVGHVSRGDLVMVTKVDREWLEIEFFDYIRGQLTKGWVVKKYLKRVK